MNRLILSLLALSTAMTPAHALPRAGTGLGRTTTTVSTTSGAPTAPAYPTITWRGATSATLRWYNHSAATSAVVERRVGTGWVAIRTLGAQTARAATTAAGLPVPADAWSCLRVRVSNAGGSATSDQTCFWTLDGRDNVMQRVELEVRTASAFSGTVGVSLEVPWTADQYEATKNHTWVVRDTGGASRTDRFDLRLEGLADQSEIHAIRFTPESGSTCVQHLGLRVDGVIVWQADYATCRTASATSPLLVSHEELRASSTWLSAPNGAFDILTYGELAGAIDAEVGGALHDLDGVQSAWWRGRPTVDRVSDDRVAVWLPLDSIFGGLDATFDLVLESTCDPLSGETDVFLRTENVDVDAASWWNVAAWIASWIAAGSLPDVDQRVATLPGCDTELYFADGLGIFYRAL